MADKPLLLQLCEFSPELEAELARDFDVLALSNLGDAQTLLGTRAADVCAIATGGHVGAPSGLVNKLPALGIIAINGVGFDKVDMDQARRRGIRVTTTPDVLTNDVADLAVGMIIALLREIVAGDAHVRAGRWTGGNRPLAHTVSGRRFGIIGMGRIAGAIAKRLQVFGAVSYYARSQKDAPYSFEPDLLALARKVDVLIVACAATAANRNLVNREILEALGASSYLVNIARGSLVDEQALLSALSDGTIAGAALDVFADEPHVPAAFASLSNVVLTPHVGSATVETRRAMAQLMLDNLRAFLSGNPLPTALI